MPVPSLLNKSKNLYQLSLNSLSFNLYRFFKLVTGGFMFKKICSLIFLSCLSIFSFLVADQKWQVEDVGTLALFDQASAIDLNDNGQVLVRAAPDCLHVWAIGSLGLGATILPKLPTFYQPSQGWNQFANDVVWQRINNSGVVIGCRTFFKSNQKVQNNQHQTPELITWNPLLGLKQYPISSETLINNAPSIEVAQCGNSSHIVFTVNGKNIYTLKEGKIINLSEVLLKEIQNLGFNFYEVKWKGMAVNNNGVIFGKFDCFEKHPYKDKSTLVRETFFLWDGKWITLIEIPEDAKIYISDLINLKHINNNDDVLFNWNGRSWLWNKINGFCELTRYNDQRGCKENAIAVLDDNTIVYALDGLGGNDLSLQNISEKLLLKYCGIIHSENINNSKYSSLEGRGFANGCLVNNKKQIVFHGVFLNECHPFLLTPK